MPFTASRSTDLSGQVIRIWLFLTWKLAMVSSPMKENDSSLFEKSLLSSSTGWV